MLLTVIMAFAGAQTAGADNVRVNINGNYTIQFLPSSGYVVNKVTIESALSVGVVDITNDLSNIDGGKSYNMNLNFGTDNYTVYFDEPGAASFYTLTSKVSDGSIIFSVGGATVTTAEEGDRVDITLSEPGSGYYWDVSSTKKILIILKILRHIFLGGRYRPHPQPLTHPAPQRGGEGRGERQRACPHDPKSPRRLEIVRAVRTVSSRRADSEFARRELFDVLEGSERPNEDAPESKQSNNDRW